MGISSNEQNITLELKFGGGANRKEAKDFFLQQSWINVAIWKLLCPPVNEADPLMSFTVFYIIWDRDLNVLIHSTFCHSHP